MVANEELQRYRGFPGVVEKLLELSRERSADFAEEWRAILSAIPDMDDWLLNKIGAVFPQLVTSA